MAEAEKSNEVTDFKENLHDQGFISFLNSLPEKTGTTFRFFDRSGYYTVHGSDALFAAKEIFKTTSVIKYLGSQKIESVALSQLNFESFIRDLLIVRHYRIEIYKNQASGKGHDWTLDCKASPGNLSHLEDLLFSTNELIETRGLLAVKLGSSAGQQIVGLSYVDVVCRQFVVGEFFDDDHFSNFESVLVQLNPRECLLPAKENLASYKRVYEIVQRSNILITEARKSDFTAKDIIQDLNNLLKPQAGGQMQSNYLSETDHTYAMSSTTAIIKYLDLLSEETNFGQFTLTSIDLKQYVRLDSSAVQALDLYPVPGETNKTHSLFSFLNKCCTLPGQRLLSQWIRQPLVDIGRIEERLTMVDMFVHNTEMRQNLHDDYLKKIPDVPRLAKKFQRKKATLQDCCKMYYLLNQLPCVRKCLENCDDKFKVIANSLFVCPIKELEEDFKKFQEMVETTIDLDLAENGEFLVRPDFDKDLKQLSENMNDLEQQIKKQLGKVAHELNLEADKTVKLESSGQLGYYFRVTRKEEKALRGKKSIMIIDTKQNGVRFHTPSLRQLNEKYIEARNAYENQQVSVVDLIIGIASGYHEPMQALSSILAQLDVLVALSVASLAAPKQYVRPTFLPKGSGIIDLEQARHPCVEMQDDVVFVPNNVKFDKEKENFFIITGPNMGGKSTYIRSVGVIVLMAQIGCFVPCDKAVISIVDAVLARVGAGDKQLKGVSTFMAEMLETAAILRSATQDSLIVIDELGRGTSTYDGFGLAWAISEHIATKLNSYCLFATHFHELTALSNEVETVGNLHVTALTSNDTLTMLYKVKPGICDQSFGIHVAELAHFPQRIIDDAKEKVREFETFQTYGISKCTSDEELRVKKRARLEPNETEIIQNFLERVKALPIQDMSDEDVFQSVQKLKDEVKETDNAYINELIGNL